MGPKPNTRTLDTERSKHQAGNQNGQGVRRRAETVTQRRKQHANRRINAWSRQSRASSEDAGALALTNGQRFALSSSEQAASCLKHLIPKFFNLNL